MLLSLYVMVNTMNQLTASIPNCTGILYGSMIYDDHDYQRSSMINDDHDHDLCTTVLYIVEFFGYIDALQHP